MADKKIRGNFPASEGMAQVDTIADLKALVETDVDSVTVLGYFAAGDIEARVARFDSGSTTSDNGGTVIIPTYSGFGGTGRWLFTTDNVNVKMFGAKGDGTTDDTVSIQSAVNTVDEVSFPTGTYGISSQIALNTNNRLIGIGNKTSILLALASYPESNMLIANNINDFKITNIGFNMQNTINTSTYADINLANIIFVFGCERGEISYCHMQKAVNRFIRLNAESGNENVDMYIHHNELENGARGGIDCRRFGNNIHVHHNVIFNAVNSVIGGVIAETPLGVVGTNGVFIHHNKVTQDNGDGGSIIVEFIDRESTNVRIWNNTTDGMLVGVKVGASTDVRVWNNNIINASENGIYFEGVDDFIINGNQISEIGNQGIICTIDGDTTRVCNDGIVKENFITDINLDGNALGVPVTDGSAPGSYAIDIAGGSTNIDIIGNSLRDNNTSSMNGIKTGDLSNYKILRNDLSGLDLGVIGINNKNASASVDWEISGNIKSQTSIYGSDSIPGASNTFLITPNVLAAPGGYITAIPTTTIGSASYFFISPLANQTFNLRTDVNVTVSTLFNWFIDVSKTAKGTFGLTT